jgi:hypothetical protein
VIAIKIPDCGNLHKKNVDPHSAHHSLSYA